MDGAVNPTRSQLDRDDPWPGLEAYEEASEPYFSGREAEISELARRVLNHSVTVLFGKSGLGKSSLLKAGLFPRLRAKDCLPIYVRLVIQPGAPSLIDQVRAALFAELSERAIDHPAPLPDQGLWEYLHQSGLELWTPKNHLVRPVFVFDQFEELFTLGRALAPEVERFQIELADLAENRIPAQVVGRFEDDALAASLDVRALPYKIVISLREDFLADLESWRTLMPTLRQNRMRLLPMGKQQAFEAVHSERTQHLINDTLANQVVAFLAGERTSPAGKAADGVVEPALLSLFCRGINEQRKQQRKLHFDAALIAGAEKTIVSDFYRSTLAGLPDRVREFIEEKLVTDQGFRNSYATADALARKQLTPDELEHLVSHRLLRREHHLGTERIELTHDLLTKAVVEERDRRRSARLIWVIAGLVLTCGVLFFGALWAWSQSQEAQHQRAQAQSRELAAMAQTIQESDPRLAIRLALHALDYGVTHEAHSALLNAMHYAWPMASLAASGSAAPEEARLAGKPEQLALSADGVHLAVASEGGLSLWDISPSTPHELPWPASAKRAGVSRLLFTPDGRSLAVARHDGISLLDVETGAESLALPEQTGAEMLAFSSDGRWLGVSPGDGSISLWDREARERKPIVANVGEVLAFTIEPNTAHDGPDLLVLKDEECELDEIAQNRGLGACLFRHEPALPERFRAERVDVQSECALRPQSVSPGNALFSATYLAHTCIVEVIDGKFSGSTERDAIDFNGYTEDVVWSQTGVASMRKLSGSSVAVAANRHAVESIVQGVHFADGEDLSRVAALSSDGMHLAIISADQQVKSYSLGVYKGLLAPVMPGSVIAVSPDASWFALQSEPGYKTVTIDLIRTDKLGDKNDASPKPIQLEGTWRSAVATPTTLLVGNSQGHWRAFDARTGGELPAETVAALEGGVRLVNAPTEGTFGVIKAAESGARVDTFRVEGQQLMAAGSLRDLPAELAVVPVRNASPAVALFAHGGVALGMRTAKGAFDWTVWIVTSEHEKSAKMSTPAWTWRSSESSSSRAMPLSVLDGDQIVVQHIENGARSLSLESAKGSSRPAVLMAKDVEISPLGRFVVRYADATGDDAVPGKLDIIDRSTDKTVLAIALADPRRRPAFGADDRWIALDRDGSVDVFDLDAAIETGSTKPVLRLDSASFQMFHAHGRLLQVAHGQSRMLVPLDLELAKRWASWLAAKPLSQAQRCFYLPDEPNCDNVATLAGPAVNKSHGGKPDAGVRP